MDHNIYLERSARIDTLDELVEQIEERMTALGSPKPEMASAGADASNTE